MTAKNSAKLSPSCNDRENSNEYSQFFSPISAVLCDLCVKNVFSHEYTEPFMM
jgi:hypothetical protein